MEYLFDKFSKLALTYRNEDLVKLYNYFLNQLSKEEVEFTSEQYIMFYKVAEAARFSPLEVQNELLKDKNELNKREEYFEYED